MPSSIFMQQPPDFEDPKHPIHVCYLNSHLWTKTSAPPPSPRAWFLKLKTTLLNGASLVPEQITFFF